MLPKKNDGVAMGRRRCCDDSSPSTGDRICFEASGHGCVLQGGFYFVGFSLWG